MYKFSVIIPTCDRPDLVRVCIDSVLSQTFNSFEIIVVDNGKNSLDIKDLPDAVKLERLSPLVGASKARNAGAKLAQGEYLAFLDDDDTWDKDYLYYMNKAIDVARTQADFLVACMADKDRNVVKCLTDSKNLMPDLLFRNPGTGGSNIVVNKNSFFDCGGFDENLFVSEDRAFALEMILAKKNIICVPKALTIMNTSFREHLSIPKNLLMGRKMFIKKYRHLMGFREYIKAWVKILYIKKNTSFFAKLHYLCFKVIEKVMRF